ncbi:MAG: hypothetical protein Q8M37_04575 [Nevskia sp.]|nr:hypothetical protein [Nevskia sp.]
MNKPATLPIDRAMSLELLLTVGLPVLSIAVCAVLAFVSYTRGFSEIAQVPTQTPAAVVARP